MAVSCGFDHFMIAEVQWRHGTLAPAASRLLQRFHFHTSCLLNDEKADVLAASRKLGPGSVAAVQFPFLSTLQCHF